ncbi:pyrroloquinoline quinone biosynthesis protein PqqB (plasmid) [Rhizobium lusitanum]|uniref:pyrroloquinoline quinone biosynthesis protein PqqB n=1 Tax=Rhizobium lusitanum TaxID=293958 RepID=UPI0016137849|nr:pyrroloquinoline quinone biosynthesis protein PqqB [Rhizobium lusitanum]QND45754.1 pyrroloquinoline quinone biosynthesis protein PqqB [Rhizobium lusitanum]
MTVRFLVLGAAAGGGLPQWNCGCPNCVAVRQGALAPQTQSSLAVSVGGSSWLVVNASPDIRQQLLDRPALWPKALRDSPIKSVVLTNGDVDHVAGLLTLREKQPFQLLATKALLETLEENPIFKVLDPAHVKQKPIELETPFFPLEDLETRLFAVAGKVPLYLEKGEPVLGLETEQTVGMEFRVGDRRIYYIPGCGAISPALADRIAGADLLFFDGTLFTDDEMIRTGTGQKTGRRMGHMPISGFDGSLQALSRLSIGRSIYIHINNTNPIWRAGPERAELERHGFAVGYDGMEITLATGSQ